jgi:hypothetical protein
VANPLSPDPPRKGGEIVKRRYYTTFSKPRVWFGFDGKLAIMRFRSWEAEQKEETIRVMPGARVDAARKRVGIAVPKASRAGLPPRS